MIDVATASGGVCQAVEKPVEPRVQLAVRGFGLTLHSLRCRRPFLVARSVALGVVANFEEERGEHGS